MQKKKVTTNFFSIYQSILRMGVQRKRIIRKGNVKVLDGLYNKFLKDRDLFRQN
jgi:hypothetical protein